MTVSYSNITGSASTLNLASTNINITGNNIIAIDDTRINTEHMNITINSNNKATLLKIHDAPTLIYRNNIFNINSNNSVIIYDIENSNATMTDLTNNTINVVSPNINIANIVNSSRSSNSINGNITLITDNLTLLKSYNSIVSLSVNITNNLPCKNITIIDAYNSTVTAYGNHINATTIKNNGIKLIDSKTTLYTSWPRDMYNDLNINTTNPSPMITLINSTADIQNTNIIQNTTETPLILIENSNATVIGNYLQTLDLSGDNSIEVIDSNATVENNTPNETGYKSQIIEVNIPENIIVKLNNTITVTTTDIFNQEINGTITPTDGQTTITTNNNTINYTPQTTGQKTLTITYTDPTGKYDTTTTTVNVEVTSHILTVDPITTAAGKTINITARITAANDTLTDINKGKVTSKVNGKTLKDANGKVIYVKVVNGTATIKNYEVPVTGQKKEQL